MSDHFSDNSKNVLSYCRRQGNDGQLHFTKKTIWTHKEETELRILQGTTSTYDVATLKPSGYLVIDVAIEKEKIQLQRQNYSGKMEQKKYDHEQA